MIGQTISHYKILEKLGEGGMGVVYKALDTKLEREVALKFLPPHLAASEGDKARFIQEARAASALNHPNVCTIHDIQEHDGPASAGKQMFIVLEFVDGQTLREKKNSINFKQAIDIGIQIADGLAAAHEKGIVHRDIKPENIMIRKDGIAQIMDFGLAKLRASGSKITRLTKEGSTVGTAGYMSPEQVQGQDTDHRSDIFSYGVLLYEMLAGQLPFKGVHETALAYEIMNVDPAPMSSVKPDIDPNLDSIVLECLEKDPRERTQSIAQTGLDLKRYRRESSRQKMSRITAARPVLQSGSKQQYAASASDNAEQEQSVSVKKGISWLPWSIAILFAICFAGIAYIHLMEVAPEVASINALLPPPQGNIFNNDIGGHIALSPDGTMLAFVASDSSGKNSLWIRPLSSSTARQLSETDNATFPFWSPDNKFIGFFTTGKLKKVSAAGAPPITICDAPNGRGATWNQEGVILFSPSFDLTGLYRVSAGGGVPAQVTYVDSTRNETNHRWPHFLPDGKHFFYTTQASIRSADYTGAIYVASLDSSVNKQLLKVSSNTAYYNGYLLYVRQKSVVAQQFDLSALELKGDASPVAEKIEYSVDKSRGIFSISNNGILTYQMTGNNSRSLAIYDRTGKKLRDIGGRRVNYYARFSRDGTKLAFDSNDQQNDANDIWVYDLTRNIGTRFTFDQSGEWNPVWSPDGNSLVYASDKGGSGDIYVKNANGTDADQLLLKSLPPKEPLDWSPDGKYILYEIFVPGTYWDLLVVPVDGDHKPVSFLETKFEERFGRFSPDGRWVVYQSDESGREEIYVRPFPSGNGKWQISSNGGTLPFWSRDGKEIFYGQPGGAEMAAEVNGTGTAFTVGTVKPLFDVPRALVYDVTADGKQFLAGVISGTETAPPVTLVTNWDKDLQKK